jgi:heme oxygenase (biliverdin-IX-beta and delta-forming)
MQSRRAMLREATCAQHRALDEQLARLDLGDAVCYRSFLEATAAALLPLEALLVRSGVAAEFIDWPQRRRADALRADLLATGGSVQPLSLEMSSLSRAEMFGMLYVLEGSRLGARVLLHRVPVHIAATRYLSAGDPSSWPTFLAHLESTRLAGESAMTRTAVQTFEIFQRAFERCCLAA